MQQLITNMVKVIIRGNRGNVSISKMPDTTVSTHVSSKLLLPLHFHGHLTLKTLSPLNQNSLFVASHIHIVAKSLQSCPTLCDPIDGSPRGSPVPGILQARTLEWVAISFSSA